MHTYDSRAIANAFLDIAKEKGCGISPMKLQKLIYFAHGWGLALTGNPLIDEPVEAWDYGPVIPNVYHAFKQFGRKDITEKATDLKFTDGCHFSLEEYSIPKDKDSEFVNALLHKIWDVYGKFSAIQLSNMTHMADTPWAQAYHERPDQPRRGRDIDDLKIKEYFLSKMQCDPSKDKS